MVARRSAAAPGAGATDAGGAGAGGGAGAVVGVVVAGAAAGCAAMVVEDTELLVGAESDEASLIAHPATKAATRTVVNRGVSRRAVVRSVRTRVA
jgi:hypothetical protein